MRAQIRKRAILALHKVLTKYPELTPQAMTRLRERLEDPDPGKVSSFLYKGHYQPHMQALLLQLST